MTESIRVLICQRCGRGFILTATYRQWLARWGEQVVVPVLCRTCFQKMGPMPKLRGQVKWFDPQKHYGYIVSREREEVFFHQRQILRNDGNETRPGQTAHFHLRHSAKGPEALNVELSEE